MASSDDPFFKYYAAESLKPSTLARFAATKSAIERAAGLFGMAQGPWHVADIGCGAATQCSLWARDGHRVSGIDINERLIALGRERIAASGLPIELTVGTAAALPWPDASMDICISPELLEHVRDWETCLREVIRVLKPGGVLYLSTTNKLCPVQEEYQLPAYSWYPGPLKRHCERLAVTTHPEWVNHATYPAVNWFSYFGLRAYLSRRGMRCADRFDIAALRPQGGLARLLLGAIRALPPVRWAAQTMTPYTVVFAQRLAAPGATH